MDFNRYSVATLAVDCDLYVFRQLHSTKFRIKAENTLKKRKMFMQNDGNTVRNMLRRCVRSH